MNPYQFLALWMLIQFYGTHHALGWADVPSTLFMVTVFCYARHGSRSGHSGMP